MNERCFLPITKDEVQNLGWDRPDFVLVSGDAYIDHPSFGTAIIARVLEKHGYRVAILPQPDWRNVQDFKRFGRPRLGFLVNSGNIDSMVNHYTAAKKPRSSDSYTPGGKAGKRPDRAVIVYTNKIREAYKRMPIIIGGIEASLRRFAHYDYWDDKVRRSILVDSGANLLIYGMGERPIVQIADALNSGVHIDDIDFVPGTAFLLKNDEEENSKEKIEEREKNDETEEREDKEDKKAVENKAAKDKNDIEIDAYEVVRDDKEAYGQAYMKQKEQSDAQRKLRLFQAHGRETICVNPPPMPLNREELDEVYALPFTRLPHPSYTAHIPALDEVEFSITSCRGCFGSCSFCALTYHQGRVVRSRSHSSILTEAKAMVKNPGFKGYIHDVGGPTANFREPACALQEKGGACSNKLCLFPKPCENLRVNHNDYTFLLQKLRAIPGVKKVFVRSGLRYDYILYDDQRRSSVFMRELLEYHVSGQLKIAPEHIASSVLDAMGKPYSDVYERFVQKYEATNKNLSKEQYLVPYFMSSHPGSDLNAAIELACYMKEKKIRPEQVQDFYPTPGTLSTTMFFTGIDPRTGRKIFVPRTPHDKKLQRALLQSFRPENAALVREALRKADRDDLIGFGSKAIVKPEYGQSRNNEKTAQKTRKKTDSKSKSRTNKTSNSRSNKTSQQNDKKSQQSNKKNDRDHRRRP